MSVENNYVKILNLIESLPDKDLIAMSVLLSTLLNLAMFFEPERSYFEYAPTISKEESDTLLPKAREQADEILQDPEQNVRGFIDKVEALVKEKRYADAKTLIRQLMRKIESRFSS